MRAVMSFRYARIPALSYRCLELAINVNLTFLLGGMLRSAACRAVVLTLAPQISLRLELTSVAA